MLASKMSTTTLESRVLLSLNSPDGDVIREISNAPPRRCSEGEIPCIDLSGLYDGDTTTLGRIAAEIKSAAETSGVFYIINHGVAPEIIEKARVKSLEYYLHVSSVTSGAIPR
jgi:hypothetical protein